MNNRSRPEHKSRRRIIRQKIPAGVFLLPSILTLGNILLGFSAIITVVNHHLDANAPESYFRAGLMILLAGIFDALDGRVARLTNSTSPFGAQLDSIADVVSFGLAPGIVAYCWALNYFERLGWIASFMFLGCGAIRLARFNASLEDDEKRSKRFFTGLPIPAAAGCIAVLVMFKPDMRTSGTLSFLALILVYLLSLLMVSKFRYRSFKDIDWGRRRPFGTLFFFLVILTILLYRPIVIIFMASLLYAISGVIAFLVPDMSFSFFKKLDRAMSDVKILDDEDNVVIERPVSLDSEEESTMETDIDLETDGDTRNEISQDMENTV